MRSLSLDREELPRLANGHTRSSMRRRLLPRTQTIDRCPVGSGSDMEDWERSCSPGPINHYNHYNRLQSMHTRTSSTSTTAASRHHKGTLSFLSPKGKSAYVIIHEYIPLSGDPLLLGERMHIIDNGDPDWLHGFKIDDASQVLHSFPSTCVASVKSGELPMKIVKNVFIADQKLRLYRDQIVFAQPVSMRDGKVMVRTETDAYVPVHLRHLSLL